MHTRLSPSTALLLTIPPLMWAGMECLVVPRHLGWTDVGTWPRLEQVLDDQRVTSIGPCGVAHPASRASGAIASRAGASRAGRVMARIL